MGGEAQTPIEAGATGGEGGRLVAVIAVPCIVAFSFILQGVAWAGPAFGLPGGGRAAFTATVVQATLLSLMLALLAFFLSPGRYGAMFKTWLVAALALLALSPARLLAPAQSQAGYLTQTVILLLAYGVLRLRFPVSARSGAPAVALALAFGVGVFGGLPWIRIGSLGSPLDVLIAAALALALGLVASHVVARFWLLSLQQTSHGARRDFFTGGIVIGTAWLILASGIGLNGIQFALMLGLPAFGWAAMGVTALGGETSRPERWMAAALLVVGLAGAGLAFVDSDGMALVIQDAILGEALGASLMVAVLGWLFGLILGLFGRRTVQAQPSPAWLVVPIAAALAAVVIYASGGQTGMHGDRLFVVLRDQADVSAAVRMVDYDERRLFVYQTLTSHAERTQAPLRAALDRLGVAYTPYYLVNGLEVSGGLPMKWWLSRRSDVAAVMPSPSLRPQQEPLAVASGDLQKPVEPQWNLVEIGAPQVWQEFGARGQGIVVGQSDSGVQPDHPELADSYRGRDSGADYNWFDPWYGAPAPVDYGGHGTHTLGSVLGDSVGVAPDAEWIACANLPRNLGSAARYLDCMQFMLAPFPLGGDPLRDGAPLRSANVINNSWGCPQEYEGCAPESLRPAVTALRDAGIFVVASAGNDGPGCSTVTDPISLYDESFTVGAVDQDGNLASFSSRGPVTADGSGRTKPDIVAPGVEVLSSFPGSTYQAESGTSMAGPHVAGVVALMWSANPALIGDIERTEQLLIATARPYTGAVQAQCDDAGGQKPDNQAGYGIVDAYGAVERAVAAR